MGRAPSGDGFFTAFSFTLYNFTKGRSRRAPRELPGLARVWRGAAIFYIPGKPGDVKYPPATPAPAGRSNAGERDHLYQPGGRGVTLPRHPFVKLYKLKLNAVKN